MEKPQKIVLFTLSCYLVLVPPHQVALLASASRGLRWLRPKKTATFRYFAGEKRLAGSADPKCGSIQSLNVDNRPLRDREDPLYQVSLRDLETPRETSKEGLSESTDSSWEPLEPGNWTHNPLYREASVKHRRAQLHKVAGGVAEDTSGRRPTFEALLGRPSGIASAVGDVSLPEKPTRQHPVFARWSAAPSKAQSQETTFQGSPFPLPAGSVGATGHPSRPSATKSTLSLYQTRPQLYQSSKQAKARIFGTEAAAAPVPKIKERRKLANWFRRKSGEIEGVQNTAKLGFEWIAPWIRLNAEDLKQSEGFQSSGGYVRAFLSDGTTRTRYRTAKDFANKKQLEHLLTTSMGEAVEMAEKLALKDYREGGEVILGQWSCTPADKASVW